MGIDTADVEFVPAFFERPGAGVDEVVHNLLKNRQQLNQLRDDVVRQMHQQMVRQLNDEIGPLKPGDSSRVRYAVESWVRHYEGEMHTLELQFGAVSRIPDQPTVSRLNAVPIASVVHNAHYFADIVFPTLGTLLGAWLQARYGRKVRIKVGDIEAEARTAKEVDALLKRAQEIKQQNEPKRIYEQ